MEKTAILLVEDNEDDVFLLQCALEDAGLNNPIHVVESAEGAMAYLTGAGDYADRDLHPVPSVVFIDLTLPGRPGHELLQWMSSSEDLRHIPRVVLTGSDDPRDLKRAYESGVNCYLRKPLTFKQLTGPSRNLYALLAKRPVAEVR